MAPRAYKLQRRADSAAATRERIVTAAADVYRERGVAAATIGAIAKGADVSRGTVLHHFGSTEDLLAAVLDVVLESIEVPDERVLTAGAPNTQRIHEYVDAMVRFYERSNSWWEAFRRDMERPDLQAREQRFWVAIGRLQAAALGESAADPTVAATVGTLLHPWTVGNLGAAGLDRARVTDVLADLIVDIVRRWEAGAPTRP